MCRADDSGHSGSFFEEHMSQLSWLKGKRGEWYLVVQAALFVLLLFGPRSLPGQSAPNLPWPWFVLLAGAILFLVGIVLSVCGTLSLGKNLSPLPYPKEQGRLVVSGVYRIVRHPIYSGVIFIAFGWGMWLESWPVIGYALLILIFFDIKSRREEFWLAEKYPEYAAYRKRVRKLIPFVW
jgi:protein-S-isoprenylcysteine O-methyltransferase Ste14